MTHTANQSRSKRGGDVVVIPSGVRSAGVCCHSERSPREAQTEARNRDRPEREAELCDRSHRCLLSEESRVTLPTRTRRLDEGVNRKHHLRTTMDTVCTAP